MSASGKGGGKGGGQNRSAGGLKTGGAVQPMGGGFYQQPMQMYQPSSTQSIYNPGNRLFDRMTPGFQSDYRPGLDFYGPSQYNGRLLVNQPNPGYYQQFMAPGSNYAPPPEPVNPDPTPEPTQPQGPVYDMPPFIDTPFGRIDLRFLQQNANAATNQPQAAAAPPPAQVAQATNQNTGGGFGSPLGGTDGGFVKPTGGYDGSGINPNDMYGDAATNNSSAPILDQAAGNTPQISPYEQRIQTLMGRGMTREQAMKNQSSAISQGADYDLSGFVTDDEWLRFTGQS